MASLVDVSKTSPLGEWLTAVQAARAAGKIPSSDGASEGDFDGAETPQAAALHVGQCGWSDCHGIFHRNGPLQFDLGPGLVSIVYVEALKAWCLLAEVVPLYPLGEQRFYLGLDKEGSHGAQLLYIRHSSCVLGQWEPVIGPAPGPEVTVYKEVAVRQVVQTPQTSVLLNPGAPKSASVSFGFSFLFLEPIQVAAPLNSQSQPSRLPNCGTESVMGIPLSTTHFPPGSFHQDWWGNSGVGSMVLDILFNYLDADWRGGIEHGNVWGLSAVEAMLVALRLWSFMQDPRDELTACKQLNE